MWTYLYRAVDSLGQTIDFLLSARRDAAAAKRFFRRALAQPHIVNPQTITVDKNAASLRWHSIGLADKTLAISAHVRWPT